uniref:Uncharacterized protein n=1 Tax=Romanomermis culicivorax TaxID=13658 RepID=A0A915HGF7_ROMCU
MIVPLRLLFSGIGKDGSTWHTKPAAYVAGIFEVQKFINFIKQLVRYWDNQETRSRFVSTPFQNTRGRCDTNRNSIDCYISHSQQGTRVQKHKKVTYAREARTELFVLFGKNGKCDLASESRHARMASLHLNLISTYCTSFQHDNKMRKILVV